jgi:23S rRNA-/tRNA-specific pseudouridylate synthase
MASIVQASSEPDALPRPQPVHRLDAAVGGLMLCAKTSRAAAALSLAFEDRRVDKRYMALLCGRLEPVGEAVGSWHPPAGSSGEASSSSASGQQPSDCLPPAAPLAQHELSAPVDGKESTSRYSVMGYSRSTRWGGWLTTVALWPLSGRKHQLRQHAALLGCPIVGDGL